MAHLKAEETPSWAERLFTLQPAVVRSFLVTVVGLGAATGTVVIDDKQTSLIINFVLAFLALGAGFVIKGGVTPNAKVVVRDETPLALVSTIVAGDASPKGVAPQTVTKAAYQKEIAA